MKVKGKLIAIGGKEDKGEEPSEEKKNNGNYSDKEILQRIVEELEGKSPVLELIASASENYAEEAEEKYTEVFKELGLKIGVFPIRTRKDVDEPAHLERLKKANGVFFTGGDQLRLTSIFGGTEFLKILLEKYTKEKFVYAGTSAGAAAASDTMIYEGSNEDSLMKNGVSLASGFGLVRNIFFDTHFVNRGRFGRMFHVIAANPTCLGVGLGEDTAVLVTGGNHMEVIGSGHAIIVDGHHIQYNNMADVSDGDPLALENIIMHALCKGFIYDADARKFCKLEEAMNK